MSVVEGFVGAVGNTPLIRLARVSEETGCEILGKAEFMNPGGSVKDRAARAIVADAERRGALPPGGTVVEGTAGNTGIGLAHVCNARGYRCVIVMPDNQSPEKYRLLEMLGAEVHKVPDRALQQSQPVPEGRAAARRLAPRRDLVQPVRQHRQPRDSPRDHGTGDLAADRRTHRRLRRRQPAPAARSPAWPHYLKSRRREVRCVLADPPGSSLYEYVRNGTLKATGSGSITEGIGIGRVTANLKDAPIDDAVHIEDAETVALRLPAAARGGAVPRQHQRHQRRGRVYAWRASSGPGTRSSRCCATAAPSTSRASSTANGSCTRGSRSTRPPRPPAHRSPSAPAWWRKPTGS